MRRLFKVSVIVLFFAAAFIPAGFVRADTGPKPTMDFQFSWEAGVEPSTIVSGIQFQCGLADCSDAAPLEKLGPQGLYCETYSCRSIGYGFASYSMLEIEFSDGVTRRSNIFDQVAFDSYYTVYVRPGDLLVEPIVSLTTQPAWVMILIACACVLAGIGLVVGLVLFLRRRARQ